MRSTAVLPRQWDEVLNRMQQTVAQHLGAPCLGDCVTSPVPAVRLIPLSGVDNIDSVIDVSEQSAAEVDAILQDDSADLGHWLAACRETEQKLAECLEGRLE